MIFKETDLSGACIVEIEKLNDNRGFFARGWCQREFSEQGLNPNLVQSNISYNISRGTLRGMHYQTTPHEETKLIRCTKGAIFDVIIDLRPESSTYMDWFGIELNESNYKMLFVPEQFAHGFITLEDETEIMYHVSEFYAPGFEDGIRYDDPAFNIEWPIEVEVISEKDKNWPLFTSHKV